MDPAARLRALEPFPLTDGELEAVLQQFTELERGVAALRALVDANTEPATGFDATLGVEP